jgi:hypothetical protein
MSEHDVIRLRTFGLHGPRMNRIEEQVFPYSPDLTVGRIWSELQRAADPKSMLSRLQRDMVLALVNGTPVHRLNGWDTGLAASDTVTFMVKAFGG